jgi:hypothetical protein
MSWTTPWSNGSAGIGLRLVEREGSVRELGWRLVRGGGKFEAGLRTTEWSATMAPRPANAASGLDGLNARRESFSVNVARSRSGPW